MKKSLGAGLAAAVVSFSAMLGAGASAEAREFCRADYPSGRLDCGYDTVEQCRASASGRGGNCFRDPNLGSVENTYAYSPRALSSIEHKHAKSREQ